MYFWHDSVNWDYKTTNWDESSRYEEFKEEMNQYYYTVLSYFKVIESVDSEVSRKSTSCKNYEPDIVLLIEKNKEFKEQIQMYEEEVEEYKSEHHNLKRDQPLLSVEIKKRYEAFVMAKRRYKKELQMYFTIETITGDSCVVYVQFLTAYKRNCEDYSMRLRRNMKTGENELIDMTPRLSGFPQLCEKLLRTDDMPGFLFYVRQSMKAIREKGNERMNRKTIA